MRITFVVLAMSLVGAVGCKPRTFECNSNMECTASQGGYGRCLPGSALEVAPKYCSFVDTNCASGWRFDDTAGDFADECVPGDVVNGPDAGVPDGGASPPDGAPGPDGPSGPDGGAPASDATTATPDAAP